MTGTQGKEHAGILLAYRFFYVFLLSASVCGYLRSVSAFQGSLILQAFVLTLSLALLAAVDCIRGRIPFCFVSAVLCAFSLTVFFRLPQEQTQEKLSAFQKLFSPQQIRELCLTALLCSLGYLLWLVLERFRRMRALSAVLVIAGLIAAMVLRREVPHWGVAASLLYLAATLAEGLERGWKKNRQGGNRAYFLWIAPFLAVYFLVIGLIPHRDTPYDWHLVRTMYQRAQKEFTKITQNFAFGGSEDFGISTSGFSDDSGFFGNLGRREREVLYLKGWPAYGEAVYLTGKIFDTFDGRNWTMEGPGDGRDFWMDALETRYAAESCDAPALDFVRNTELEIEYRYFHTKYLFAPLKTVRIAGFEEEKEYRSENGLLQFAKKRGYGTDYLLSYGQLNLRHPEFVELLRTLPLPEREEIWERVVRENGRAFSMEELREYRERMRRQYQSVPEIGERVRAWLDEVLEGAGSQYEKLERLERALGEFTYRMNPGELPQEVCDEKSFLEYFLLESREGYCSYFATAFVLLARAEGIPARYVQGFCVPGTSGLGMADKETLIRSDMAHAWPEVYFEGFGWVPFEPTPGFLKYRSISWKTTGDREREKEEQSRLEEERGGREETPPESEPHPEEEEEPKEEGLSVREMLRLAAYLLLILAAFLVLFLAADAFGERMRQKRRSDEESFCLEFLRALQILEMMGFRRRETETLADLEKRLTGEKSPLDCREKVSAFISICEETFYGKRIADQKAAEELRAFEKVFLGELKRQKGRRYPLSRAWLYLIRAR